jgi:hypothetical protein
MTLAVPRLETWLKLGCLSGAKRRSTGGFIAKWYQSQSVKSEDGEESFTVSIPLTAEAAGVVMVGDVGRIWRSDTLVEEWLVRKIAKRRDQAGHVDVTCGPISYRLADCEWVPDPSGATSFTGQPRFEWGLAGTTLANCLTAGLVTNAPIAARLPELAVGSIASQASSVTFDIDFSFVTPQALINQAVTAAQTACGVPLVWRYQRNASTNYQVVVLAAL